MPDQVPVGNLDLCVSRDGQIADITCYLWHISCTVMLTNMCKAQLRSPICVEENLPTVCTHWLAAAGPASLVEAVHMFIFRLTPGVEKIQPATPLPTFYR